MITIHKCNNCETELDSSWMGCPNCGKTVYNNLVNCVRCYQLISDENAFCPYCAFDQHLRKDKRIKEQVSSKRESMLEDSDFDIDQGTIRASLKFDTEATMKIVNSANFTKTALYLILIAGFVFSLTTISLGLIFGDESPMNSVLKYFILSSGAQIGVFIWVIFFSHIQFQGMGIKSSYKTNTRYMGIWSVASILRDIIMYPAMLYIAMFEGSSGKNMAITVYITLSGLILAYMIVHLIIYYRSITNYGLGKNILFFVITMLLTYFMFFYTLNLLFAVIDLF